MKPVSTIVRRTDGLRVLECQFLDVKVQGSKRGQQDTTKRIAESRLTRLRPFDSVRTLSVHEKHLLETWNLLGKATLSCRTYKLLFVLCTNTTAAPTRVTQPVPVLTKSTTDIRPWLCDPVALAHLFDQLRAFDSDKSYGQNICDPNDRRVVYDPWFIMRSGERIALGEVDIAPIVWERAASYTQGVNYAELKEIEEVYLASMEEKGMSELAEMILGHTKGQTGANWINVFNRVPREARLKELEHWMIKYSEVPRCPRKMVYLVQQACKLDQKSYLGLSYLWEGLAVGAEIEQLVDGMILWEHYAWENVPDARAGGTVDVPTLQRLTNLLSSRANQSEASRNLWNSMLEHPVLRQSLRAILDEPYGHRGWLLRIIRNVQYGERDDELAHEFNREFKYVSKFLSCIPPRYREKAVEYFEYVYWDRTTKIPAGQLMAHIATLCFSPFTQSHDGQSLWCKLVSEWDGFELPLSSWKRIDSASRSNNQSTAIEEGLDRLDEDWLRSVIISGLKLRARLSLDIIRLTRRVLMPLVEKALFKFKQHPLLDVSLKEPGDLETFGYLMGESKELEKWKLHLSGDRSLRAESAEQLFDKLEGRRIETLLMYFRDELAPPVENADGLQLHTRLYAGAADENRRAYRKLIQRYSSGGENGILFHPMNQQWLKSHHTSKKEFG